MLNPDGTKRCPRCSETKLAGGNFYKSGQSSDGYSGHCINCTREAAKEWRRALPEDLRRAKDERDHARIKNLPADEKLRFHKKRYEQFKEWVNKSPENKARQRAWQLAYKQRDPERRRQMNQIHNNSARCKRLGVPSTFQFIDWVRTLEHYGHACAFCGATGALLDMEHLDAIDQGGHNVPGNVVPACRPCNAQKWRKTLVQFCAERRIDEAAVRAKSAALA